MIKTYSQKERDKLILKNQALIKHIVNLMGLAHNFEEYFSAGQIGLIKAANTFDENKGIKFSTYAGKCIKREIYKQIEYKKKDKRKCSYIHQSLDEKLGDTEATYYEIVDSGVKVEEEFIKQEKTKLLYKIIAILEPIDRYMICSYFGLGCYEKLTYKQIEDKLGLKTRQAEFRIKKLLRIMRKIMEDKI